jgi:hypothetical protein
VVSGHKTKFGTSWSGAHEISFEVIINDDDSMLLGKDTIYNEGTVTFGIASVLPFRLEFCMF